MNYTSGTSSIEWRDPNQLNSFSQRLSGARSFLLGGAAAMVLTCTAFQAQAQIDELIVIVDPVGLLEEQQTQSVFGLDRALVDTPRSISVISNTTMERYSIEDIDDFITVTPGTFGNSYFGVPGAISVRGRLGDNYFRGFKRVQNNGFFPLPVGASERIEIIRGPTPAIYGAGRIGGLLNFYPKTTVNQGLSASDGVGGSVSYTGGRYDKNQVTGEINIPFLLGGRETGISLYAEYEDSKDFVRGRNPEHTLVQLGVNHEFDNGFSVEFGGMYYDSDGYNQTGGWNRLTQELIDDGTYITGYDTDLVDLDGNGYITQDEAEAGAGAFYWSALSCLSAFTEFVSWTPWPGECASQSGQPGTAFDLDEGVGTAKISRRDQMVSEFDVAEAENFIVYLDLIKEFDNNSTAKIQFFYDENDAKSGTAHGFAGWHQMNAFEVRGSYEWSFDLEAISGVDVFLTASHRRYESRLRENFLSGFVVLDRLDLSVGSMGNDVFDTPFTVEPGGLTCGPFARFSTCNAPWDSDFESTWNNTGVAIVTDISITDQLALLFSGRYDHYSFKTIDEGTIDFGGDAARFILAEGDEDAFSYSISGSYDFGGVIPYVTYANGNEPLTNSSGGVSPGTIVGNGGILADSELLEAGIKFELLDETLFATFAIYQQERVDLDIAGNQLAEESEGFEAELNWVIDPNWAVTGAATFMNVEIKDPDPDNCAAGFGQGEFINVAPTDPSIYFFNAAIFDTTPIPLTGATGYGGIYRALNASCLPELADGYDREGIPERVLSLFFTYTSDETDFGTFGATFGGTYVSETGTLPVADEVRYPDYTVFRLAAFAEYKNFSLVGTIDNLFDKEYFVSSEGTFQNVSVHPGRGRIWRLKGKVSF